MSLLAPSAADFPVLPHTGVAYLDSGATSQTPIPVIEAMDAYYREYRASVHRGVYPIAALATEAYEGARDEGRRVRRLHAGRDRSSRATRPRRSTSSRTRGAPPTSAPATSSS